VLLVGVCSLLIWMRRLDDAVLTGGLVAMNVIVGMVQEGRAKRHLDHIALLTRPTATVVREGRERVVDPGEVVLGDILVARPGDQIVVDGQVVDGQIDADESLLTGESDHVPKRMGDTVSSGTFCVTGSARYEACKVGAESLANTLTASARVYRQVKTPLQRDIAIVIRVLVLLASLIGLLLALSFVLRPIPAVEQVQIAAVLVSLVPQGLIALITITYALGMVRMLRKGTLVQQANAVESLSHVDVLCLDKTGTLTTNRLRFCALHPLGRAESEVRRMLGDYAASVSERNRTAETIYGACGGQTRRTVEEVPFSSARKWGAVTCDDAALHGTYVLGAPEVLQPALQRDADLGTQGDTWAAQGLRVLLFAYRPDVTPLHDAGDGPTLPSELIPLGLVSLSDELRPDVQTTLAGFAESGVCLKIISGDHPQTVAALAAQAGLGTDLKVVSGLDLATLTDDELARMAEEATIFGRITPQQKERLVHTLREKGDYVAMIGDGVNDVLSLKSAHLGIALHSGTQAARSVADMVLLNDAFGALPAAFKEGQRIMNAMHDVMCLLLTRTLYVTLLIVGAMLVGVAFPMTPKSNSILSILTAGLPPLALAVWAQSGAPPRRLMHSVIHFVLPAAFTITLVALPVYLLYALRTHDPLIARSALTMVTVLCGLVLIPFVKPPTRAWVGGEVLSGDWRPTILAVGMLALYGVILSVPFLYRFFGLTPLPVLDLAAITGVVAIWAVGLRFAWRAHLFERFLGLDLRLPASP
jgi:cation-transporting P-type ATPase E